MFEDYNGGGVEFELWAPFHPRGTGVDLLISLAIF